MVEVSVDSAETEKTTHVVILRAGEVRVAVDALDVVEIVLRGHVTRVPYSPEHFLGLCVVAGRLLPVFSLRALLEGEVGPPALTLPRLVIFEGDGHEVAFSCDEAQGVVALELIKADALGAFERGRGRIEDDEVALLDSEALVRAAMLHTYEGER